MMDILIVQCRLEKSKTRLLEDALAKRCIADDRTGFATPLVVPRWFS